MSKSIWEKAKAVARNNSRSDDWAFIMDIYHYFGGEKQAIFITVDDERLRIIGTFTDSTVLLIDDEFKPVLLDNQEVMLSVKHFEKVDTQQLHQVDLANLTADKLVGLFTKHKNRIVIK